MMYNKKTLWTITALVVVVGLLYFFFFRTPKIPEGNLNEISSSAADALIGRELLALLAELRATKIDKTLFDRNDFESLRDFSREIPNQPVGRPNPFLPLGATTTIAIKAVPAPTSTPAVKSLPGAKTATTTKKINNP